MNWDRIEGNWKQLEGRIRAHRARDARRSLQNSYGIAKDGAEKQIVGFQAKCERNQWVQ